jgi:predicted nucleic acid-binding Zn ribbon protein
MLKPLRHCTHCGAEMRSVRSTKAYCSDACRKKAARGVDSEQQVESQWMVDCLRHMRLVGKIWPAFCWDDSPPIWALLVPFELALEELNPYGSSVVTEAELRRALRDCEIATSDAGNQLQEAIKAFYLARKDRRIKK